MKELEEALTGSSAHTPASHILEALPEAIAHRLVPGAPHTIYQELWHITFWLGVTLDWCHAVPSPYPAHPSIGFPSEEQTATEPWPNLCDRFLQLIGQAAIITHSQTRIEQHVQCPSRPGLPTRTMTVEEQLISLAAHNTYHLGRIVLLRQLLGSWPPPSGSFTW